jgi:DNA-binding beta-propeller fold protein YncE
MAGRLVRIAGGVTTELLPRKPLGAYGGMLPAAGGALYYCDMLEGVVYRRAADGTVAAVAGAAGAGGSFSGDGGPATAAGLNFPVGLAQDAAGHLYVADASNHRVRRVDARTGVITTLAGEGGRVFAGRGPDASLNMPRALAFDAAGNLYIADTGHNQVKHVPRAQLEAAGP